MKDWVMRLQNGERNSQEYLTWASRVKGDILLHTFCTPEKDTYKRDRTEIICIQVLAPKIIPHFFFSFWPKIWMVDITRMAISDPYATTKLFCPLKGKSWILVWQNFVLHESTNEADIFCWIPPYGNKILPLILIGRYAYLWRPNNGCKQWLALI